MPAGELELFHELDTAPDRGRQWRSRLASLAIHALAMLILLNIDFAYTPPPPRDLPEITVRRVTPLVAPPPQVVRELTQKAPNTKDVAKEIDLAGLLPKPEVKAPPTKAAAAPRPSPGPPQAPSLPSAPKIEAAPSPVAQLPPMGTGNTNLPPPPAPEPPQQKPKIMFESVAGSGMAAGNTQGARTPANVQLTVPKGTVDEAVSAVARNRTGGIVVGDNLDSGLGQSMSQIPTPGKMGSALELLSDPQGADFRPYLIRVLTAVRRNWFAVIPESARLGQRRGRVVIQFAINKDGAVPKLVIATPSGAEPLDRAAVAGISASNPFPPLPAEFRGDQIRVSLSFVYNQK